MERQIIVTQDGSHSIYVPEQDVSFHSVYGAIQESMHVFIDAGLKPYIITQQEISIFEMGFGTGLNALLTLLQAEKEKKKIYYRAIEKFPLEKNLVQQINYCSELNQPKMQRLFEELHESAWDEDVPISPYFILQKINMDFVQYTNDKKFDIIYYDAFAPSSQPELWTIDIFKKLRSMLFPSGSLLTYCSKGSVQRAMQAAGFMIEKLPGPKHKREIIRGR